MTVTKVPALERLEERSAVEAERKTRLEPEAAPRTVSRLQRYPRLPDGRLPLGGIGVARPGRRQQYETRTGNLTAACLLSERKTRLEPEAAPRTVSRLQRYPRLSDGRLPLRGIGVARPGRRHYMKPEQATLRLPVCFQCGKRDSSPRLRLGLSRAFNVTPAFLTEGCPSGAWGRSAGSSSAI